MAQKRRRRQYTPPVAPSQGHPDDEEVISVQIVDDSSPDERSKRPRRSTRTTNGAAKVNGNSIQQTAKPAPKARKKKAASPEPALTISSDENSDNGDDDLKLEDVDVRNADGHHENAEQGEADDLRLEDVDLADGQDGEVELEDVTLDGDIAAEDRHADAYADVYKTAIVDDDDSAQTDQPVVYHDGKGQPNGISISLASASRVAAALTGTKRKGPIITPRDRMIRLATHKWTVLSMISHARYRNALINDDQLRDDLYAIVPNSYLEKLRAIHPKKIPSQDERVRQFESFLRMLTAWWKNRFHLQASETTLGALRLPGYDMLAGQFPPRGKRVDGWIVESASDRHKRQQRLRKERQQKLEEIRQRQAQSKKGKGRAQTAAAKPLKSIDAAHLHPFPEITLFGIGDSTTPVYLRLSDHADFVRTVDDLIQRIQHMSGSREVSAQLFAALCRALGIPARLVISIQAPSWSVGAGKVAGTTGAVEEKDAGGTLSKRKKKHMLDAKQKAKLQGIRKATDVMTSDEESFLSTAGSDTRSEIHETPQKLRVQSGNASASSPATNARSKKSAMSRRQTTEVEDTSKKDTPKGKGKAKDDGDYRDERWRNLDKPLDVEFQPKLRPSRPKALRDTEVAAPDADAEPVDLSAPPTMWVEVFSKPWKRWITVDPVRGAVEPLGNRHMEPSTSDKTNRLVYVVAFEEDGYARDVTARYTRTLHSRISRMRPPPIGKKGDTVDWWAQVVQAIHRPQRLDRDAEEDVELESAASREPMPSSVAAFKDHPVYALEKHLKREEVIFPAKQAGTFQGMAVFLRANIVSCKSARQWYNEGRVVKDAEEALKWVKSRGYTLANKRAEEEARQQGLDGLQEGLYAMFQTDLYEAPPVENGVVPTNAFGNIDLFVDTMLPPGGAHVPYNGAGKVAKALGVHFAEAIVGFEFRKHRSMPKILGIVVPEEQADAVTDAFLAAQHTNAEREFIRKRDRMFKNWKKLLNAIKIQERIQREYGTQAEPTVDQQEASGQSGTVSNTEVDTDDVGNGGNDGEAREELHAYADNVEQQGEEDVEPGGFLID